MSNKANNSYRVVQESDLLVWAKKQKFTGAFDVSPAITTSGVPVVAWFSGYLEYSADNVFKLTVTDAYTGITYTNVTYAGAWSGWKKIATAEPPQRFSIPFASGWSNTTNSYFYKNQFGEVTIRAEATKNSTVDPLGTLFVLPEGYRPPQIIQFAVTFNFPFATVIVMVEPNGKVSTRSGVTEVVRGYFMNISFLTA